MNTHLYLGVSAFSATQQYYPLLEVSTRVLPALCQVTLDNEKSVRDLTFQTIKGFLGKLENVSEDARLKEMIGIVFYCVLSIINIHLNNLQYVFLEEEISNTTSSTLPTWTGWAVNTVASKFYSSKNPTKHDKSNDLSKSLYFIFV